MRFEILFLGLGLSGQACAQTCGWFLNPDDCICMMSTTGGLLKDQTSYCCRAMGYKMSSNVRATGSPPRWICGHNRGRQAVS